MRSARISLGAAVLCTGFAFAQQPQEQTQQRPNQPGQVPVQQPGQQGKNQSQPDASSAHQSGVMHDQAIAQCLAIDNAAEVQIGEYAVKKLKDEGAKEFAEMMIKDHRQMLEKLTHLGATKVDFSAKSPQHGQTEASGTRSESNSAISPKSGVAQVSGSASREQQHAHGATNFISLKQEIAQQCLQSMRKEMEKLDEADFDKCFMAGQVFGHQHMLDSLTVLERHTSGDLKDTIGQAKETTEKHLEHAKKIVKELE